MGPPLVDADWHAFCHAMYQGIEGSEREELYFHYREMSKAARARKPRTRRRRNSMIQLAKMVFWEEVKRDSNWVFGLIWTRGTACVCAKPPRIGMSQAL